MLSDWVADLTSTDRFLCKLRAFILNVTRTAALWLTLLATVDRWLSSSITVRFRQISSLKNVHRAIIIILIASTTLYVHILYCYESNLVNASLKCYGITITCRYDHGQIFYVCDHQERASVTTSDSSRKCINY
ncbi:unnamed protein product [Rotaria socialis]|uniref:G-protein coupled receptors family 1 profile domain-containing protein n=1 Tax=Rotaria socialis TaxID=392032 RepID=A0A820VD75_9BILA|nr:unnamed protein product [Rotaria socialis]